MKLLKALGITTLISGAAVIPTWIYNEVRWENHMKLMWTQDMVRHYSPEKISRVVFSRSTRFKSLWEAEYALRDSVEEVRRKESEAKKSYF